MKVLVLAMILLCACLAEKSYAMKPLESFLLDRDFYGQNYFRLLPNDNLQDHPAWLVDMPNQWSSYFGYDGIIDILSGDWKGTRSYNYNYNQYLILHLPADEIFDEQVLSYSLEGSYFFLGMKNPKSEIDVNDYENYIAPSLNYSVRLASLPALSFGIGLVYFISNYGETYSRPFANYEVRINPEEGFYFGFRHRVEYFTSSLSENLGIKDIGNFDLSWSAANLRESNELYAYREFFLGNSDKHSLLIKVNYTPSLLQEEDDFSKAEMSLAYVYDEWAGIGFFANESNETEKGTIKLKSMPQIPPLYAAIGKEYGVDISALDPNVAEMEIKYNVLRFGTKIFGFMDSRKKNRLEFGFSRGFFDATLSGITRINIAVDNNLVNIGLTPFSAKGDLLIMQDEIGGAYDYNAENWGLGIGVKYIAIYDLGGNVSYGGVVAGNNSKIQFDDLKLWQLEIQSSVKITKDVKLEMSVAQYLPAINPWQSEKSHKNAPPQTPNNPPSTQSPNSTDPPPAPSHSGSDPSVPLIKYLSNTGFSASIGITYYF
jgi:hypothetical protein